MPSRAGSYCQLSLVGCAERQLYVLSYRAPSRCGCRLIIMASASRPLDATHVPEERVRCFLLLTGAKRHKPHYWIHGRFSRGCLHADWASTIGHVTERIGPRLQRLYALYAGFNDLEFSSAVP